MADLADVESAVVTLVTLALYPNGLNFPSGVGVDCRIYRGWPASASLDSDLKAGRINVTLFPDNTSGQTVTPYESIWRGVPPVPTLTGTAIGSSVSFAGTADLGQIAGVRFGNRTFTYRTVAGDTPGSVAANLAAMIRTNQIVQLVGASLTIPGASDIVVRVTADGLVIREIRRQTHDIRLSFWCPTPGLRDNAVSMVDRLLARHTFIDLPDTSHGRIIYRNTAVFDQSQSAILYRRDLVFSVEYPTLISDTNPSMAFGDLRLNAASAAV